MILRRQKARTLDITECHGGKGVVRCTEYLGEYDKATSGFKFIHDNTLEPGVSIGEHLHSGDEEIYIILDGRGTMLVDGSSEDVSAGDVCITRSGHRHSLTNTGSAHMRLLVVGTALGGR